MIRKTMRVGAARTSVKLEPEFWSYLKEVADGRRLRLSALVNEVAEAAPDRTNQGDVRALPVILTPLDLQRRFVDRLADLRSIIAQAERALAGARDLERSLMAQLLR